MRERLVEYESHCHCETNPIVTHLHYTPLFSSSINRRQNHNKIKLKKTTIRFCNPPYKLAHSETSKPTKKKTPSLYKMSMFASTPQENVEKSFLAFYEGWLARQENLLKQLLSVARNGPLSLPAIYGREIQRGKRRRLPSLFSTLAFRVRKGSPLDWGLQALSNSPFSRRRREGVNGGAEGEGGENEGQDEEGGEGADGGSSFSSREHGESADAGTDEGG